MAKFQFGDKVLVRTFNDAGKLGEYMFTVKGYLYMGGRHYPDTVCVFPNEHVSTKSKYGLYFPERCCTPA